MANQLKYPAIYRHFEGEYYTTMGISKSIDEDEFQNYLKSNNLELWQVDFLWCIYNQTNQPIPIVKINGEYKHFFKPKKSLAIYKDLYSDKGPSVMVLDLFLSDIDKCKHPQSKQVEIFKLISL